MSFEQSYTISLSQFPPSRVAYQPTPVNAEHIAREWATRWENILIHPDISALETVFQQDCWWRDMLALSWDFRTICGFSNVCEYVKQNLATSQLKKIRLRETGEFQPALRACGGSSQSLILRPSWAVDQGWCASSRAKMRSGRHI